jgi:aspartate racemase
MEKVVGIIGGMGPEATVDLMARVIRATPALDDVDHIRMVVDNNPKVPSRIKALIEGDGPSPVPVLQGMARKLAAWGVDFLVMPCNTAHYYHQEVQQAVSVPLLDMIGLAVEKVVNHLPHVRTVGLMASTAVLNLKLYENAFTRHGVKLIAPVPPVQAELMAAIRKIKTSKYGQEVTAALQAAADHLVQTGAEVLLVACTELSIIADAMQASTPVLDAAQILAEAVVRTAIEST